MSTLSEYLLKDRSVEYADSIIIELDAGAGVAYPASRRIMFHLVLEGSAFIRHEGANQPVELGPGEYAVLFYGKAHTVHGSRDPVRNPAHIVDRYESGDEPALMKVGNGAAASVRLVSSALSLVHALPAFAAYPLPHLLAFAASGGGLYSGRALQTDMAQVVAACRGPGASAFLTALANLHVFQCIRDVYSQIRQMYPLDLGAPVTNAISATMRVMRTHPEKDWTVETLAREVGLSRSCFAAKFRTHVGVGPMEHLTAVRMKLAATLLRRDTELPLWDISRRVGYKNESSFSRAFKLEFGVSPRVYSKQFR